MTTGIVVGGGLSGMAAANTLLENGCKVVLVDKSSFCGGNSTKATSGINGAATKTQKDLSIADTVEIFTDDCLKGGAKKPELVAVLCKNSGPDVDWLTDVFGLDLSLVARLGGHSMPRTHRGKERFPGMTITYALIQMLEKVCEANPSMAKIITKARADKLLMQGGKCIGLEYTKQGVTTQLMGPVILATGGFGCDFASDSLLAQYRPDLLHLPTSNGEHCTGDGIKMGLAVGAKTIDLEWVQVHPTGLVNPNDPDAKVKFLAAEALRGVGGLVFDANGNRFCNELGRRDYVTGQMWKNKGPFRLCLNKAASDEIIWHCKHYTGRGVMKFFPSGKELAKEIGCDVQKLVDAHDQHYEASQKQAKDPEGGPYPAYPSGRSWDKPSGETGIGKKFYHNVITGSQVAAEPFYVAIITPIIHYCMGGLEITTKSEVLGPNSKPIPGLYAAGEVMGGVHGNNRLGGNSLLDCVVFGRVSGKACAEYLLDGNTKAVALADLVQPPKAQAVVLGGGLSGMAAANTLLENGAQVVLLDKSSFCGGNSTKATSGINGAATKTQATLGIEDSVELFTSDCLKGGAKKPEIVKVLCENSGPDVDWLSDVFNLDLSLVARLGGHSAPRTHRGKERFPGMTITYALIQMLEKVCEMHPDKAKIVTKARATKLIQDSQGRVVGVEYTKGGRTLREDGPVIVATGGFGCDFSDDSLLAKYRPDLLHLPTSNGEHCTGDGIKMGEAIGARTIDLEWVQVHPTGLVNPNDPDAKVKFLAAEALRGVGGLIFDANGNRFCNELGRRDYVTGEMWKNKGPYRLCLNKMASDEIIWHCKHYTGRGVMKFFESGKALAAEIGCDVQRLVDAHDQHYQAASKQEKDPEGGPYPAYPSGRSWDEPSGKTGIGKKFYHNVIPGSKVTTEPFYVAFITPIIHYCMGGLEITEKSEVLGANKQPIPGLYAAGEVMGGVHGNNRLGGNSLLDCVVFGRVSGKACAEYMLGDRIADVSLKALTNGGLTGAVTASKHAGGSYEDNMNGGAAEAAAPGAVSGFTLEEVAKHTTKDDCWVVVNGEVLDVTKFLPDHPGGELAILTFAGKDATEEFNMIHPPDVIPKYAPDAVIGRIGGGPVAAAAPALPPGQSYYTMDDVAKHTTKDDCWVVLDGKVLDVTSFLPDHPGGELAILTFAGKDATEEFNMIHPPDVVGKYAPEAVIGVIGDSASLAGGIANDLNAPLLGGASKSKLSEALIEGEGCLGGWSGAIFYMAWNFMRELCNTIFNIKNIGFSNDRTGLTRSAIFLVLFMVIHAVGNLHIFLGPDDFNGYGYFYVRLYCTGFGFNANIVEEYCALAALLHVAVGLKRTWDINRNYSLVSGKLNLAMSGVVLLIFMIIHLFQFRFGETQTYYVRPPPYLINFWGILRLQLFWTDDTSVKPVGVRDIYKMEFDLFQQPGWVVYYMISVGVFLTHACLGWAKLVPATAFKIPKRSQWKVTFIGYCIFGFVALCYWSFPMYCYFCSMKKGALGAY